MAIYKNKDIEVNVNEKSADVGYIDTNFYTEDKSTSSIRITIKNNKRAVDLSKTNLTPKLDLFHSDGSIFMDENINNVLPEQGIIQYKISDKVIKHPGKVNAKLFLKNETQSVHVANFNFTIKDSGITDAVSKEITVNIVDDAVRRIIQENAIELLGEGFKDDVSVELKNYVNDNVETFKGPKGDKGDKGEEGIIKFENLTEEQKLELKGKQGDSVLASPKIYTRDEYNQLATKDPNTLYFISEV
ncbi:BppU family phage baseplate upper protein [Mammaliicoccus sp. A-M2]|uniref:BppU family phage baseplate upper protein n=1 Tax=Mammaliicoccus sp. A-M2 TaxID=2898662 RepID=UPI001EFAD19C|nr:BppU family phage baseplate upper protein [Mammaliicoccus sp. A-M2]